MRSIELRAISKLYTTGGSTISVLDDINISIQTGDMIAIVGPSGSGKSTLMNILGTLDKPTSGDYLLDGQSVLDMDSERLATLRSERFGFIFQGYQLLDGLTARQNVELPSIYARKYASQRTSRAITLLQRLGLGARASHRPGQLSGGQQQRVVIARALMNGGEILFADEPTGALDSKSGKDVLSILRQINDAGSTVILVTHDPSVAAHAHRVIELCDGRIVRDEANLNRPVVASASLPDAAVPEEAMTARRHHAIMAALSLWQDALRGALAALQTSRIRSVLTMLGVIIGISSVSLISIVGDSARSSVARLAASIETGSLVITRGATDNPATLAAADYFTEHDFDSLFKLSGVKNILFDLHLQAHVEGSRGAVEGNITGVSRHNMEKYSTQKLRWGRHIHAADLDKQQAVIVIDNHLATAVFGKTAVEQDKLPPLLIDQAVFQVIGILKNDESEATGGNHGWATASSLQSRLGAVQQFNSFSVEIDPAVNSDQVREHIDRLLTIRRGQHDFRLEKTESQFKDQIEEFTLAITLALSAIGGISMLVGGIGVMNIMLVSVSERMREIGIRMAIGARRRDVGRQFIVESTVLCALAGLIAICLTQLIVLCANALIGTVSDAVSLRMSPLSLLEAAAAALMIGVVFGWYPARRASALNPVEALARK